MSHGEVNFAKLSPPPTPMRLFSVLFILKWQFCAKVITKKWKINIFEQIWAKGRNKSNFNIQYKPISLMEYMFCGSGKNMPGAEWLRGRFLFPEEESCFSERSEEKHSSEGNKNRPNSLSAQAYCFQTHR